MWGSSTETVKVTETTAVKKDDKSYGGFDLTGLISTIALGGGGNAAGDGVKQAIEITRKQFNSLQQYVEQGEWTWKLLGLFGGVGMIATGVLAVLGDIFTLSIFSIVVDVYIILFGFMAVALEYKENLMPQAFIDTLKTEARILYRPYGRAVLYIFFGIILFSQLQNIFMVLVGLYLLLVGGLVAYFSSQAEKALKVIAAKKFSDSQIEAAFKEAVKGKSKAGVAKTTLTAKDFALMMKALMGPSTTLSANELESAISLIDDDSSNEISLEEFKKWYHKQAI